MCHSFKYMGNEMKLLLKIIAATSLITGAVSADDDSPFTGEFVYTPELWTVASGGIERSSRYLHNFDLTLEWDLSKSGLDGGTLFIYGLSNNKSELTGDIVGDLQTVSNIDNGEVYRLEEAWYQQEFSSGRVKLGLIDLNSEFDAIDSAGFSSIARMVLGQIFLKPVKTALLFSRLHPLPLCLK